MSEHDVLGPIDYLAVEFPTGRMTGSGFRLLRDVVDRGLVLVMDLEFVRKGIDGTVTRVPLEAVPVVWTVAEHPLTTSAAASPTPSAVARRRGTRREPFVMASFSFVSSSSRERREALLRRPSCSALRVLAMYAHTSACATRARPHGPGRPRWWRTSGTS